MTNNQKDLSDKSESQYRKYKVIRKIYRNNDDFEIEDIITKETYIVDFWIDWWLEYHWKEEDFADWLDGFVWKTISIPEIYPRAYLTRWTIKIVE